MEHLNITDESLTEILYTHTRALHGDFRQNNLDLMDKPILWNSLRSDSPRMGLIGPDYFAEIYRLPLSYAL
jgi:hypothetical protein